MSWQIIDLAEDGRYLHSERQWLIVKDKNAELGRVALSDIQSVLAHCRHATYSHDLLLKLSGHDIPLVLCDDRHQPVSILISLCGHHQHAGRARAQMDSPVPQQKRLWRDLVKKKILEQARTLDGFDKTGSSGLKQLAAKVRAGDPDNIEARAARYYWPRLFGSGFRRDRENPGLNAHLNYGYTILRSAMARAVTASGLVPSIGVGHINARNNFCLVDDLIEPFRPLVDRLVKSNASHWQNRLEPEHRQQLAGLMSKTIMAEDGETDVYRVMVMVVSSLVKVFERRSGKIHFPEKIAVVNAPALPGITEETR